MAVAATGGDVTLEGARLADLRTALDALAETGTVVEETKTGIRVARNGGGIEPVSVETQPFPGFPTDLQAQLMALLTMAPAPASSAKRFSKTASCTCRNSRGSAPTSSFTATRRRSRASRRSRARPSWRPICEPRCRSSSPGCGRGRDGDQPRLPSRPGLRAARAETAALRRRYRTPFERLKAQIADVELEPRRNVTPLDRSRPWTQKEFSLP